MTSMGRLKRSCLCAIVAVIASSVGVLTLGFAANQQNNANLGAGGLLVDFVGISLAPGWLLMKGMLERISLSSPGQILVATLLVLLISLVVDAVMIFVLWEAASRIATRSAGSRDVILR